MKDNDICSCPEQLAMAAIPLQKWCELYDWHTALEEGTVFTCLNLPFFKADKGCCPLKKSGSVLDTKQEEREKMMDEISSIGFVLNDLTLYLDTHPDCPDGTPLFYELLEKRMHLLADYAKKYNPLTQLSMITGNLPANCYGWSDGPMPWEGGCI